MTTDFLLIRFAFGSRVVESESERLSFNDINDFVTSEGDASIEDTSASNVSTSGMTMPEGSFRVSVK